ncbi:MAG: Na+/H+ antiporter NhaC family protein [Rubripirellula sp.]
MDEPSFLSLIPAMTAIGLAFLTRQVLLSLFLGVVAGGLVMWISTGDIRDANFVANFFIPALGTKGYAQILLIYLWCLGGLMGIWEKTGGAIHFAEVIGGKIAKGPRSSLFLAWVIGCIFHQGGTVSTVLAGTSVRPVSDKHRVSHEELSYIVDSTASPVATILPFNAWPAYVAALIVGTVPAVLPDEHAGITFFFSSIRYNYYGIFAVIMTLLTALSVWPWLGRKMSAARRRARETGKLDADGSTPLLPTHSADLDPANNRAEGYTPSLLDFFVPIGVLLTLAIVPYVTMGISSINEAFMACVLSAMILAAIRGMRINDILNGFVDGCKTMTIGAIILGLAVTIGFVAKELHTADYLVALVGDNIPMLILPALLTLLCMIIAFSCGTSFGTYAVVFPIAMPLAWAVHEDPTYLSICFGAVLGGAVFGDQCSPISDTTILSSMFTGCDLMDHVTTQLPLALFAAGLGMVASTITVLVVV